MAKANNAKPPKKARPAADAAGSRRLRDRLLRGLPDLAKILRGSLVARFRRCGRPTCHCARKKDPGHGPAYYLMVTIATGKTVLIYIPSERKHEVETWIENFRRARETLERISTLNRELLRQRKLFPGG